MELPKDFKDLSTVHTPIGGLFELPKVRKLCLYTVPNHFFVHRKLLSTLLYA